MQGDIMLTLPTAKAVERIFFLGMQQGWAFGKRSHAHPTLEGWKAIFFAEGEWKLVDEWSENGGATFIYHKDRLVWVMRYFGTYPEAAIPCLKAALADRYAAGDFCGGRGAKLFRPGGICWYENEWRGSFINFSGRESVSTTIQGVHGGSCTVDVGQHAYWGGMLI
jgi:hypothetical protein